MSKYITIHSRLRMIRQNVGSVDRPVYIGPVGDNGGCSTNEESELVKFPERPFGPLESSRLVRTTAAINAEWV